MTKQDDWARFCEMMQKYATMVTAKPSIGRATWHVGQWSYNSWGYMYKRGSKAKPRYVGYWRKWLAAGTGPSPF